MPKHYAKGEERRDQLIRAAAALLDENDLSEVSMHKIAAAAGIPSGSAYHFFDGPSEVFAALAARFGEELQAAIIAPYPEVARENWHALFRHAALRGVTLYETNPAYGRLILGGTTTPAIKRTDRENDYELGCRFAELMDKYFVLPQIDNRDWRLFHAIEIFDLFLSLSHQRFGRLEPELVEEGILASLAYLRQFIPDRIPRRETAE